MHFRAGFRCSILIVALDAGTAVLALFVLKPMRERWMRR
jgi:hypothetical protein